MAPILNIYGLHRRSQHFGSWRDVDKAEAYIVESWFVDRAVLQSVTNLYRGQGTSKIPPSLLGGY
jgi:hypothetical protein